MTQQLTLDVEKYRPLGGVRAVGNQVAGVHHEIRHAVFQNCRNDAAMHVVAGASIAIDYELEVGWGVGSRLKRTSPFVTSQGVVIVSGARLKACVGYFFGAQDGSRFVGLARLSAQSSFAGFDNPSHGGGLRSGMDHKWPADEFLGGAQMEAGCEHGGKNECEGFHVR